MTIEEAIQTIKMAISEVEWNYSLNYVVAFEMAIKALEAQNENLKSQTDKYKNTEMLK